jgi:hypothetical protein
LQGKIDSLSKIVNHKDYVIKEMEAVKTFRDNFKSKKGIFSAVYVPSKTKEADAKSLHYLQEEDSQSEIRDEDGGPYPLNLTSSARRLVTFR